VDGACSTHGRGENAYIILVWETEGKRPRGRLACRWKNSTEIGLQGFWDGFIWLRIGTSGGSCEHSKEASGSVKAWDFLLM
jgi:hypothetical protein